ncbi:MAG: tetratricopeptide repeat protein [Acidobacteriota bacterium]|nr:tetratricopeptide repeat protein [Acidobacteriota bacterium]
MTRLKELARLAIISLPILSCNSGTLAAQTRAASAKSGQTSPAAEPVAAITAALRRGNFALASRLSATAVKQHPREPALWALRGFALSHTQQLQGALAAYKQALALVPDYLPALEGAAQLYYAEGDGRAILMLRRILTAHAESATTHAMLAVLEYRQKDCTAAAADFQAALPTLAASFEALEQYGFCLVQLKQPSQAILILEQALNLQPASGSDRVNVALAQMLAHENKPALATLEPLLTSATPSNEVLNLAAGSSRRWIIFRPPSPCSGGPSRFSPMTKTTT